MPEAVEQLWPSFERKERWEGKRHIPMVDCMIDQAVALSLGKRLSKQDIAAELGISPTGYSNKTKDGLCTYDFISDVCTYLNIPVHLFSQVSELSTNYEEKYLLEPSAALADFENALRHHLRKKASHHPYQDVFDTPTYYEPADSAVLSLKAFATNGQRGALAAGAEEKPTDYRFAEGDTFRFEVTGPRGRNVILLETQVVPYADYSWGLLNGKVPSKGSLIGPLDENGRYIFEGRFFPPMGTYRVTAALLDASYDADKWRELKASEPCADYLLNGLAEAVKATDKKCWIATFTYDLLPSIKSALEQASSAPST